MKKLTFLTVMTCLLILLQGCGMQSDNEMQSSAIHRIDAKEAKQMMENEDVIVVDVRTEAEYNEKHIPNAILVPNETIQEEALRKLPDTSATYLIHCRSGVRSKQASEKLVEMGYEHIYDFGGINNWPYEMVSE